MMELMKLYRLFEGGIRVPGIIVLSGIIEPGTRTDAMIQSTDFLSHSSQSFGYTIA